MNAIAWSESFALQQPRMDRTHQEFVALLQRLAEAAEHGTDGLDALLAELAEHSVAHFNDENERMAATAFPPAHCHLGEHEGVIGICKEVRGRVEAGEYELGRVLARELDPWFRNHLATMDRMLAYWLNLDQAYRLWLQR